tara:strand:- start:652 stop:981 length:330 start_codon:yes stop_codon:yes gene_type:complete
MKLFNFRNTPVDFNPSKCINATISAAGLTFPNGDILAPDSEGFVRLKNSATLFINVGGDIRVTPLNNSRGSMNSVLFKNVQGDFHRIIKGIWITDTTVTDIVIDERKVI